MKLFSLPIWKNKSSKNKKGLTYEPNATTFEELSEKAYEYLNEQQEYCKQEYKIGKYERWFYEQVTGELTFSDGSVKKTNR